MWRNPFPEQSFILAAADGTPLAELPPMLRLDNALGPDYRNPPPGGFDAAEYRVTEAAWDNVAQAVLLTGSQRDAYQTAFNRAKSEEALYWVWRWNESTNDYEVVEEFDGTVSTAESTTTNPLRPKPISREPPEDNYTWERAPFSAFWFALGDGLPRQKPPPPAPAGARYRAVAAYWGENPDTVLLTTDSRAAAYSAAYARATAAQNPGDAWIEEWRGNLNNYAVVDTFEAPIKAAPASKLTDPPHPPRPSGNSKGGSDARPQLVLAGNWLYRSADEMLAHAAEIEKACAAATRLMLRGRSLAQLINAQFKLQSGEQLRDVTYTLTLYTTENITAQEFMRRQLR